MGKNETVKDSPNKARPIFSIGKKIQKIIDSAKEKIKGVKEECVDYIEAFIAIARNYVENYPGKEDIEIKVDRILKNVASKINIPTREDTEKLSNSIDLLNHQFEAILKKTK